MIDAVLRSLPHECLSVLAFDPGRHPSPNNGSTVATAKSTTYITGSVAALSILFYSDKPHGTLLRVLKAISD